MERLGLRLSIVFLTVFALPALALPSTHEEEACIVRMLKLVAPEPVDTTSITAARSTCEQMVLATYRAQTEQATARIYEAQLTQNTIMLSMVVFLTFAGVALAAVQLLATYRLAQAGKAQLAEGGEASVEHGRVVVRSSVVGLVMLALSFAFFTMYVLYVYRIGEASLPEMPAQRDDAEAKEIPR